jgi:uncharacterized protein
MSCSPATRQDGAASAGADCESCREAGAAQQRPFAAVIKPTDRCNLACRYCYVTHKSEVRAMSPEVLEATIAKVPQMAGPRRALHFIWHGGEPLLLGRPFFERVVALQKVHCRGRRYDNCLQTNGTLLTREWVHFAVKNDFAVSLSLDGPRALHDANRQTHGGHGSHQRVQRAIRNLRARGRQVGAVAVLTRASLPRVAQIYRYMRKLGVQFRMNPVIPPESSDRTMGVTPSEYGRALCELFDLWFADDDPPHVDPINLVAGNLISQSVWGCDFHAGCMRDVVAVNPDGGVYPCGQLAGRPEFLLGNIARDSAGAIFGGPLARRIRTRPKRVRSRCGACAYWEICNGGCLASAWIQSGDLFSADHFCEGRKALFEHARSRIEAQLLQADQRRHS